MDPSLSLSPQAGGSVRLILVGAGSRGMTYARYAVRDHGARVVAIAEPRPTRLAMAGMEFGVPADRLAADWPALLEFTADADCAVIATPDRAHAAPAIALLERRLPLLLEKPMSPDEDDAASIAAAADRTGTMVCVAHVMRYTRYTARIKELVDSGAIGDVVSVEHLEPVGWYHHAHSFVRGNWRREDESSPMLLSKSCHDIDWLSYIIGRPVTRVSSFGSLTHFRPENRPARAASRCLDCEVERTCPYSAVRIYLDRVDDPGAHGWPLSILADTVDRESIHAALRTGPYGRCVYGCDNDVVDHQVVNLEYEGGVTAAFTMAAFTPMGFRKTRLFGTRGCLEGDGLRLEHFDFLTGRSTTTQLVDPDDPNARDAHLGADAALTAAFLRAVETDDRAAILSDAHESLHTHRIVWAAERARHAGTVEAL